MSRSKRSDVDYAGRPQPPRRGFDWLSAVAGMLFGLIVGYLIGTNRPATVVPAATVPAQTSSAPAASSGGLQGTGAPGLNNDAQIQAYHDIIARDPANATAQIALANLLYDAGRYGQAIGHYQRALELDPKNVNVSTDLGTALWYTGRADDALAQFDRSLAIQPDHAQTLFNIGIVKRDGKNDRAGAIAAWERLLAKHPAYPDAAKVRQMIDEARRGTSL